MQRVLVVRIGRLGDTILATPVIELLRRKYGTGVLIDFASSPGASAFILGLDPRINRVFSIAHRSTPWRFHRVKRDLEKHSRKSPYDLVINLECGSECDDFIKFVHCVEFCGRPLLDPQHQADRHCVDTEKSIYADLLGPELAAQAETSLQLSLEPQTLPVSPGAGYVVINPGFSGLRKPGYRSHRAWPLSYWQEFVETLIVTTGLSVLVNGTDDEQEYFASLLQSDGVYSLFGSSLSDLACALSGAKVLITVDTGTMHLAIALRTPVLALFGPTNPMLTGPYTKEVPERVLTSGIECQPCVNTPSQKTCALNRCMSGLEPGQVLEACRDLLNS